MKQKSVTLIEVIVSMLVLCLIVWGLVSVFLTGKRHFKRAQYKQEALNYAREKLEELQLYPFDALSDGNDPPGWGPLNWLRDWEVRQNPLDLVDWDGDSNAEARRITVTVTWIDPN